jgi:hypothetical protein
MKQITTIILIVLTGTSLFNCDQETVDLPGEKSSCADQESLLITSTKVCGWGFHYDSMSIDKNSLRYYNQCLSDKPAKEYPITCEEWTNLKGRLDWETLIKLDIHTCNVCVDGCDISIAVKKDNQYHRITFGPNQVPLQIQSFVEAIDTLRQEALSKTCH